MMTRHRMEQVAQELKRGQLTFGATLVRDMHDEIKRLSRMIEIRDLEAAESATIEACEKSLQRSGK